MYSVQQIADRFSLELHGENEIVIAGVCGLDDARSDSISFVTDETLIAGAANSAIPAFVTRPNLPVPGKTNLLCEDPEMVMAWIAELFQPEPFAQSEPVSPEASIAADARLADGVAIGPRAIVGSGVEIGRGSRIHAGAVIMDRSVVGADCIIHANVVLREESVLGDRVVLQPGVVIGGDGYGFVTREAKHYKIPQLGRVVIEDDVEIGANSTIDRGRFNATVIGRGTKIDNLVMIAHNVHIGEDCLIVAQTGISGSTRIGNRVVLAGQVGVTGHLEIADDVTVLGKSVVSSDIKRAGVYAGIPIRPAHVWKRAMARLYRNADQR